jgi:aspartyl-tRNA(Asn)/glutamyl-tRNA(Gln) amidotransferase subunit B
MEFEMVIGLEVHAELSTQSKIYCSCSTRFGAEANTQICPICTGMPGTLPMLNKKVVEYAVKAGFATNCSIAEYSKQDRKNYFYPDLPKAYQISQYDLPLCENGYIDIEVEGQTKRIGIERIHIEEDAGKLIHVEEDAGKLIHVEEDAGKNIHVEEDARKHMPGGENAGKLIHVEEDAGKHMPGGENAGKPTHEKGTGSLIDYNRCGVPLIEIVTEPDMRSAQEARAFVESLKVILQYVGVSDCKMQEGSLRVDVNLSVRPKGDKSFGTRTEMKNLSSFRSMVRAIEAEAARQIEVLNKGGVIIGETRRWDEQKGVSYSMRSKEKAHDYRFFPEPDLMPVVVDKKWLEELKNSLPELPEAKKKRYITQFAIPEYDASIITGSKVLADFFEEAAVMSKNAKAVSNFIMGELLRLLKDKSMETDEIPFPAEYLARLVSLTDRGVISGTIAKKVFEKMFYTNIDPEVIVREEGLEVVSDEKALLEVVTEVIRKNPQMVRDYRGGKDKVFGFLMGQAMKESGGKANPQIIKRILKEKLGEAGNS